MKQPDAHVIKPEDVLTLDTLFHERVKRSPKNIAYRDFDPKTETWCEHSWEKMYAEIGRWQTALAQEGLQRGDRVAIMMRNSPEWIIMDQAAMGLDLVVVPLYTQDRPDNVAYIIADAEVKVLLLENEEQWKLFDTLKTKLASVKRILILHASDKRFDDARVRPIFNWLTVKTAAKAEPVQHLNRDTNKLASIIYTSGTTGKPKGVMLSHRNMLSNAYAGICSVLDVKESDMFLSFLPLSHTLERTIGYYLAVMAGAQVSFVRSIPQLSEDLLKIQPTILISVPRIYERVWNAIQKKLEEGSAIKRCLFHLAVNIGWQRFEWKQGRGPWKLSFLLWPLLNVLIADKILSRLGGRIRCAVSGGAALPADVSRVFIGLGLPLLQGYGMTETSPVVCVNRIDDNIPTSIGTPLPGIEIKLGEHNALMVKGPNVMLGYWNNIDATRAILSADGWINTGDIARIDERGHVYITGRIKEIIVLSNGEKMPPGDIEAAIMRDTLFEHVMVLGEAKPFLSAIVVLNKKKADELGITPETLHQEANQETAEKKILERISAQMKEFPRYAQIRRAVLTFDQWTIENGFMTPTLKIKRLPIVQHYAEAITKIYAKH